MLKFHFLQLFLLSSTLLGFNSFATDEMSEKELKNITQEIYTKYIKTIDKLESDKKDVVTTGLKDLAEINTLLNFPGNILDCKDFLFLHPYKNGGYIAKHFLGNIYDFQLLILSEIKYRAHPDFFNTYFGSLPHYKSYFLLFPYMLANSKLIIEMNQIQYKETIFSYLFYKHFLSYLKTRSFCSKKLNKIMDIALQLIKKYDSQTFAEMNALVKECTPLINYDIRSFILNDYENIGRTAYNISALFRLMHGSKTNLAILMNNLFFTYKRCIFESFKTRELVVKIIEKNWELYGEEEFLKALEYITNKGTRGSELSTILREEINKKLNSPSLKKKLLLNTFSKETSITNIDLETAISNIKDFFNDPDFARQIILDFEKNITNEDHYNYLRKMLQLGVNPNKIFVSNMTKPFSKVALSNYKKALNSMGSRERFHPENPHSDLKWNYLPKHIKDALIYAYLMMYKNFHVPKDVVKLIMAQVPVVANDWFPQT